MGERTRLYFLLLLGMAAVVWAGLRLGDPGPAVPLPGTSPDTIELSVASSEWSGCIQDSALFATVTVTRDGAYHLLDRVIDPVALSKFLWKVSGVERLPGDKAPSEVYLRLRCDRRARWRFVRSVLEMCLDPDTGIWKFDFPTMLEGYDMESLQLVTTPTWVFEPGRNPLQVDPDPGAVTRVTIHLPAGSRPEPGVLKGLLDARFPDGSDRPVLLGVSDDTLAGFVVPLLAEIREAGDPGIVFGRAPEDQVEPGITLVP